MIVTGARGRRAPVGRCRVFICTAEGGRLLFAVRGKVLSALHSCLSTCNDRLDPTAEWPIWPASGTAEGRQAVDKGEDQY